MTLISPYAAFTARKDILAEAILTTAKALSSLPPDPSHPSFAPIAYLVGGYTRDLMLGRTSTDADIEVFGVSPETLKQTLEKLFPSAVHAVGKSFGIYKISISEGMDLDVAVPRKEHKSGTGHTAFAIDTDPFLPIQEAARRRDFTINAIYLDPLTGEIADPYKGTQDLETSTLRVVDPQTFIEDPLRAFRAIQLAARFNLTIADGTLDILRDMAARGETEALSHERIGQEFKKLLLQAEKPSIGLMLAADIGLIARHFPILQNMVVTPQEPEWHPEGNVWIHTCMAVDAAAQLCRQPERNLSDDEMFEVIFGAFCHDLGKPQVTRELEGRIRSRGHEEAGTALAISLASHLVFPQHVSHAASMIAGEHLKPVSLYADLQKGVLNEDSYANAVRRLLRRILPLGWKPFITACEADWRGRGLPGRESDPYMIGVTFAEAIETLNLAHEAATPLLQGRDLLALGLEPGPRLGEIIKQIEDMRDEGTVRTHEEAIEEAKKLI